MSITSFSIHLDVLMTTLHAYRDNPSGHIWDWMELGSCFCTQLIISDEHPPPVLVL